MAMLDCPAIYYSESFVFLSMLRLFTQRKHMRASNNVRRCQRHSPSRHHVPAVESDATVKKEHASAIKASVALTRPVASQARLLSNTSNALEFVSINIFRIIGNERTSAMSQCRHRRGRGVDARWPSSGICGHFIDRRSSHK